MLLFLESIARILVGAAGPPVRAPFFRGPSFIRSSRIALRRVRSAWPSAKSGSAGAPPALEVLALGFLCFPQPAPREPFHDDVGILAQQLVERREQLAALARAECRRLVVDQDRPIRVARRHRPILAGIETIFAAYYSRRQA
jgi:hypothetical protein